MRRVERSMAVQVTSWTIAALYLAVTMIPTGAVLAQSGTTKSVAVFVVPEPGADADAAMNLMWVLRDNVNGLQGVKLVIPAPVANASLLPDVLSRLEQAYSLVNGKRMAEGLTVLNALKPDLESVLPLVPVRSIALFYKAYGVALVSTGSVNEGKKAIEISLLLFRNQTNLEYAYSVDIIKMFMDIQMAMDGRATVRVDIETQPEPALVSLDSRERKKAPESYTMVPVGPHLIKSVLDGYEQYAGFFTAKRGEENKALVTLRPIPEKAVFDERLTAAAVSLRGTPESAKSSLGALAKFLGVDEVLFLSSVPITDSIEVAGYHYRAGDVAPVKRSLVSDATFLAGVKELLSGTFESFYELGARGEGLGGPPIDPVVLQKAGIGDQNLQVFDPDNPVFPTVERKKSEESITDKWWFWTGVGILAAGAVGGVVALVTSSSENKGPTGTIEIRLP